MVILLRLHISPKSGIMFFSLESWGLFEDALVTEEAPSEQLLLLLHLLVRVLRLWLLLNRRDVVGRLGRAE